MIKKPKLLYLKVRKTNPIISNGILFESGLGGNMNGNIFALLRELKSSNRWKNHQIYYVVNKVNKEDVKKRFQFYGLEDIHFIIHNSYKYARLLATAKYLFNDNSFPIYFCKRKGQIYLNTWHGTPFKCAGRKELGNSVSMKNIQGNNMMADYALYPSKYAMDVWTEDYMLQYYCNGECILEDYPRNKAFYKEKDQEILRKELNLLDKKIIAYMPTWRGVKRIADVHGQKEKLEKIFLELDKLLSEKEVFYVNLHFLIGNEMDFSQYTHIRNFPQEYETYDFLAICDCLVTDFSSVFFDFAITKRPIILFLYDKEEFLYYKKTYFPISELPFPITESHKELIEKVRKAQEWDSEDFLKKFAPLIDSKSSEKLLDLVLDGNKSNLQIIPYQKDEKENLFIYSGNLDSEELRNNTLKMIRKMSVEDVRLQLIFEGEWSKEKTEFLKSLPETIQLRPIKVGYRLIKICNVLKVLKKGRYLNEELILYEREKNFFGVNLNRVVYVQKPNFYIKKIIEKGI